jgi:hypothetical protein
MIVDPGIGRRQVRLDQFGRSFTGVAMVFEPAETFQPARAELRAVALCDAAGQVAILWSRQASILKDSDLFLTTTIDAGQSFAAIQVEDLQGRTPNVAAQYSPGIVAIDSGEAGGAARSSVISSRSASSASTSASSVSVVSRTSAQTPAPHGAPAQEPFVRTADI